MLTGVFVDQCPKCGCKQEALVGYLSHCLKCGADWRSYRNINRQPIIRFHNWQDEQGIYNDFVSKEVSSGTAP